MKASFIVKNRAEADAIRTGLTDPVTRAAVIAVGILMPLTEGGRRRVLEFVTDKLEFYSD